LILGLLFGCVLGIGVSVLREQLTPQFRRAEDVEVAIGPQLLAAIPDFSFLWNPAKGRRTLPAYLGRRLRGFEDATGSSIDGSSDDRAIPNRLLNYSTAVYSTDRRFVAKLFPRSMAAEQYRVAAARLQLSSGGSGVAVVTSAIKGEGKTTTVINLGYTLARDFGKRVLLVDCDFVYPELKCFIERPTQYGLIEYLRGDCKLEDATTSFAEIPCWIMPAGVSDDPTELLKRTDRLDWVFSQMREKFDYVLLNAPPILPVATMNVLEKHVDLLLLIVKANQTSQQVVRRALGSLRGSKPIQVILNAVASQSLPYYMSDYTLIESRQRV
jgi:capsular exopolysaccharide synthesis family protein